MANTKTITTKYDMICSIYSNGKMLEMHTLENVAFSKRKDAVGILMNMVADASEEYENVTGSISVTVFKKSLVFDGSVWHYV